MFLIEERVIACKEDMDAIEECVRLQLGCENHRCSFFRSRDYVAFRVAALYRINSGSMSLYYERLCLKLEINEEFEKIVRVFLNEDMVFDASWGEMKDCLKDSGGDFKVKKRARISREQPSGC